MYEEFYKLSGNPFRLTPNPEFYYASKGHSRVMAYLQYGFEQGDGFVVVTGPIGTGKTTLIQMLLEELKENQNLIIAQIVTTQLEANDLLKMVSASFKLNYKGLSKPVLLKNLERYLEKQASEGRRVLLIVDEAQNLPIRSLEELRMLSNYQVKGKQLLQSFLVGQEEFKTILNADNLEQLRQRVIASYHLGPLNKSETKEYIQHRLRQVGWDGDPEFADEALEKIYAHTEGIPRRVNLLCDRLMLYGSLEELHQIGANDVDIVVGELDEENVGSKLGSVDVQTGTTLRDVNNGAMASEGSEPGRIAALERRIGRLENILSSIQTALTDTKS
jgi:putative secretion ATPase (PEP-CTERM system associated)